MSSLQASTHCFMFLFSSSAADWLVMGRPDFALLIAELGQLHLALQCSSARLHHTGSSGEDSFCVEEAFPDR